MTNLNLDWHIMGVNKCITILFLCTNFLLINMINGQSPDFNKAAIFKGKFLQFSKYCSNIYNTSLVEIIPLFARSNDDTRGNTNGMCFLSCMLQRYQVMDKNGGYHADKLNTFLNSMPDSKFKSSLKNNKDKCLREAAENVCQKAYKFCRCFYRNGIAKKQGN